MDWIRHLLTSDIAYLGVDVVADLIERNQQTYTHLCRMEFSSGYANNLGSQVFESLMEIVDMVIIPRQKLLTFAMPQEQFQ